MTYELFIYVNFDIYKLCIGYNSSTRPGTSISFAAGDQEEKNHQAKGGLEPWNRWLSLGKT
jgi:hypothetical protein